MKQDVKFNIFESQNFTGIIQSSVEKISTGTDFSAHLLNKTLESFRIRANWTETAILRRCMLRFKFQSPVFFIYIKSLTIP